MSLREDLERVSAERDLYRALLELGKAAAIGPFVDRVLALMVTASGARRGYLVVHDVTSGREWTSQTGGAGELTFPTSFSRGVVERVMADGEVVHTVSALADARFSDRSSVQQQQLEAVLCVPIGDPPLGVVYLQDRERPGPFEAVDRARAEVFASHLPPFVERLMWRESRHVDHTTRQRERLRADGIIGRSRALADVLDQAALVAPHDVGALITGPTGSGKTQLAHVIHSSSSRADGPFVELNCAALPEMLVESELFGVVRGAHSAALADVAGKVAAAEGGTLFLDEIGELPPSAQAKLLQLLQSKTYYPLGSTTMRQADIRVLAATNTDLREAIAAKAFREDLYFRLHVLPVVVPPLSVRREDVPLIAEHACEEACARNDLPQMRLSPSGTSAVEVADWPGNVRELANAIQAGVLRAHAEGAAFVEARHIFPGAAPDDDAMSYQTAITRARAQIVSQALDAANWNVSEAARRLDVSRSHINKMIRALGLQRD